MEMEEAEKRERLGDRADRLLKDKREQVVSSRKTPKRSRHFVLSEKVKTVAEFKIRLTKRKACITDSQVDRNGANSVTPAQRCMSFKGGFDFAVSKGDLG